MEENFNAWNEEKKIINKKNIPENLFFHQREIWWCSAGLNIGVEINGKHDNFERPFLLLKKFNKDMIWVLPMTTKAKDNEYHYKLTHEEIDSWIILSQIKTLSSKRLLRKMGMISERDFIIINDKIKNFLIP